MQGRIIAAGLAGALAVLTITGCSPKSLLTADCHSCTVEEPGWREFSWNALEGKWQGSVETWKNVRGADKRERTEKNAQLQFVPAADFLKARGLEACPGFPSESVVMNGLFWGDGRPSAKEYEAFVPVEDGKVAYGRLAFERVNGKDVCQFRRFGRVMGKNRLGLPSVGFSDHVVPGGRVLASNNAERSISVEFLRLDTKKLAATKGFAKDGRRPAATAEAERPSLMIRVFQVSSRDSQAEDRGQWTATEEQLYRLWKN